MNDRNYGFVQFTEPYKIPEDIKNELERVKIMAEKKTKKKELATETKVKKKVVKKKTATESMMDSIMLRTKVPEYIEVVRIFEISNTGAINLIASIGASPYSIKQNYHGSDGGEAIELILLNIYGEEISSCPSIRIEQRYIDELVDTDYIAERSTTYVIRYNTCDRFVKDEYDEFIATKGYVTGAGIHVSVKGFGRNARAALTNIECLLDYIKEINKEEPDKENGHE